ncbi:Uncharacterised protein [uncultured archaeon]|nr:Uncharacterised protein [uncultured archaeon]
MAPRPCHHCGLNFMPIDPNYEGLALCNNCQLKNQNRTKQETKMSEDKFNMVIALPRSYAVQIEEKCMKEGINFSEFFINLLRKFEELNLEEPLEPDHQKIKHGRKK